MLNIVKLLAVAALSICLPSLSLAQQATPTKLGSFLGAFSNVRYSPDTGDILGIELVVIHGPEDRVFVLFQEMEGYYGVPRLVEASLVGSTLHFVIAENGISMAFDGTIAADDQLSLVRAIDGEVNPNERIRLVRGKSRIAGK